MRNTLILFAILVLTACGGDDDNEAIDYSVLNDTEINAYLDSNGITAQSSSSGLYYSIETIGNGNRPNSSDDVTVVYKGYFTDGNTFDESLPTGSSFNLQEVIKGWTEGITYFDEGGTGKLFVPAHLGYGSSGRGAIPGGAVLIFDINLLSID